MQDLNLSGLPEEDRTELAALLASPEGAVEPTEDDSVEQEVEPIEQAPEPVPGVPEEEAVGMADLLTAMRDLRDSNRSYQGQVNRLEQLVANLSQARMTQSPQPQVGVIQTALRELVEDDPAQAPLVQAVQHLLARDQRVSMSEAERMHRAQWTNYLGDWAESLGVDYAPIKQTLESTAGDFGEAIRAGQRAIIAAMPGKSAPTEESPSQAALDEAEARGALRVLQVLKERDLYDGIMEQIAGASGGDFDWKGLPASERIRRGFAKRR